MTRIMLTNFLEKCPHFLLNNTMYC